MRRRQVLALLAATCSLLAAVLVASGGTTAAAPSELAIQAEQATLTVVAGTPVVAGAGRGFDGTGYVTQWTRAGSAVTFRVTLGSSGESRIRFRYRRLEAGYATRGLSVDGVALGVLSFAPTGGGPASQGRFASTPATAVSLRAGTHVIALTHAGPDASNALDLDEMLLSPPSGTVTTAITTVTSSRATGAASSSSAPGVEQPPLPTVVVSTTSGASTTTAALPNGPRCVVRLHGKGGSGFTTYVSGSIAFVGPTGNAVGWGGMQWLYFPESGYTQVRDSVQAAITQNGCARVIVHGFSNGAAAAAKLYCRSELFLDTVVGYIIDDPVTDHAVENCARPGGVKLRLYWTGALAGNPAGWACATADWTCEGGTLIGVDAYAGWLAAVVTASPNTGHAMYEAPPEYTSWW